MCASRILPAFLFTVDKSSQPCYSEFMNTNEERQMTNEEAISYHDRNVDDLYAYLRNAENTPPADYEYVMSEVAKEIDMLGDCELEAEGRGYR